MRFITISSPRSRLPRPIIEEATERVIGTFREIASSSSPALENMVHGSFVVLGTIAHDKLARIGRQLARALGQFSGTGAQTYQDWTTVVSGQAHKAAEEGDMRDGADPDVVAATIIAVLLGVEQLSTALSHGSDMLVRLSWAWQLLLPSIVAEESLATSSSTWHGKPCGSTRANPAAMRPTSRLPRVVR